MGVPHILCFFWSIRTLHNSDGSTQYNGIATFGFEVVVNSLFHLYSKTFSPPGVISLRNLWDTGLFRPTAWLYLAMLNWTFILPCPYRLRWQRPMYASLIILKPVYFAIRPNSPALARPTLPAALIWTNKDIVFSFWAQPCPGNEPLAWLKWVDQVVLPQ